MGQKCLFSRQKNHGRYGIQNELKSYSKLHLPLMANSSFEFLDFDNTEIAFSYKSDKELKRLKWLFRVMNNSGLVSLGSRLTPALLKWRIPFVRSIVKATIFKQFVGGESIMDTQSVIDLLYKYGTLTILDYGAEAKTSEEDLDAVVHETIRAIELAASNNSVPVISTKITALADNVLLTKIQSGVTLSEKEETDKSQLFQRLDTICKKAYDLKVGVMVDAEESWMQDTIDSLVDEMMLSYNKKEVIVYNTFQLYRKDKLAYLKASYEKAMDEKYLLGAKLVRGAYMEKERKYAEQNGMECMIQNSKEETDIDYNKAVTFCVDHYENISSVCASHNAKSNRLQAHIIEKRKIEIRHPHLNFCQLYGMSDNLTFNLAKAGYNVAKYVPYGPLKEVVPYLIRRAQENTAVTSDMSRELTFISTEIARRGL